MSLICLRVRIRIYTHIHICAHTFVRLCLYVRSCVPALLNITFTTML